MYLTELGTKMVMYQTLCKQLEETLILIKCLTFVDKQGSGQGDDVVPSTKSATPSSDSDKLVHLIEIESDHTQQYTTSHIEIT